MQSINRAARPLLPVLLVLCGTKVVLAFSSLFFVIAFSPRLYSAI
jgi:hypothetical protein